MRDHQSALPYVWGWDAGAGGPLIHRRADPLRFCGGKRAGEATISPMRRRGPVSEGLGAKERSARTPPPTLWKVKNHSTQDSHVVPHHGTNWAALRLTAQIGRDAVLSESCGRGYWCPSPGLLCTSRSPPSHRTASASNSRNACPKVTGKQRKRRSPILERGRTNL